MSFLNSYRRSAQSITAEVVRLTRDRASKQQKLAGIRVNIQRTKETASRSSSVSTIQSKAREIYRLEGDASRVEKDIADDEVKIARKQKELAEANKNIAREEEREARKAAEDSKRSAREQQRRMASVTTAIDHHQELHRHTLFALERLQRIPQRIVVLFIASNPLDQPALRLDEEVRAVGEMIRRAKHRDSVRLESAWAARPLDLLQAINEHEPTVLHFSGHGTDTDDLVFQDNLGNTKFVTRDALLQTVVASASSLRLVFLNACFSAPQAALLVDHIEAAIGMSDMIGDDAARTFAAQFYSSVGFGHSVARAFDQAKAALMLEGIPEEAIPQLFVRSGIDPSTLVLVAPAEGGGD